MKTFKTVRGALNHLCHLSLNQEMSDCTDWHKLTEEEQRQFYLLLAGIQNDLGEMQRLFDERGAKIMNYTG